MIAYYFICNKKRLKKTTIFHYRFIMMRFKLLYFKSIILKIRKEIGYYTFLNAIILI